jgi:hypothetical protein
VLTQLGASFAWCKLCLVQALLGASSAWCKLNLPQTQKRLPQFTGTGVFPFLSVLLLLT